MSSAAQESQAEVIPLPQGAQSDANFGATITGIDLNNLSDQDFQVVRNAIYTHKVVIVKGQAGLAPLKQFQFVHRLDPDAEGVHGFDTKDVTDETIGVLGSKFKTIPGSVGVTIVGQGYQGDDHYGLKDITANSAKHFHAHVEPLTTEDLENGQTRFGAFHFDGVIYGSNTSRVTTLRCVRAPKGPDLTIRWDDGSGQTMAAKPGLTAFIDSAQIYEMLTDEEKTTADNSHWAPAPQPYTSMAPGGETVPLDKLPAWVPEKGFKFPMVWVNPVTGARSFQILPDVVQKLYFKSGSDAEERVVEDNDEVRVWLNNILDRICKPNILIPEYEEGDVVMFNNWAVLE
ncbi:Taurine catabolism dioxygenase TauD/TfdA [Penicillium cf. viridicatum]|uniref:Taurine catabolism dioxygenase TauD/TfdA n=1 Tax=Penicillium cf. viridicatum TaxID=2972119 RepID=A0A9W9MUH4_9EURO|nr:Taurine catabolism dioxygenase TauD/TfdA [Penicillium cf. viridicatum]